MSKKATSEPISNSQSWHEFRLIFSDAVSRRNWPTENYEFVKARLIPLIRTAGIQNFQILNYYNPSKQEDFIRFRVEANPELLKLVEDEIRKYKRSGLIKDYEREIYSPQHDAENRLESVRQNLERQLGRPLSRDWKIVSFKDNKWAVDTSDSDEYGNKLAAFETFLTRILGRWTRLFVEEMKIRPDDRWLISLLVHLLLNSLTYPGPNPGSAEDEIRRMPPI